MKRDLEYVILFSCTFGTQVYLKMITYSNDFVYCFCGNGLSTEMMNSDCMLNRDYQGWVDFGRRDAE